MAASLMVFLHGQVVETVRRSNPRRGAPRLLFNYETDYLRTKAATPLSLSVPLDRQSHDITNWMQGLLPDNSEVLKRWKVQHNTSSTSPMDLFATHIGQDCPGAIQFCDVTQPNLIFEQEGGVRVVAPEEVAQTIARLRKDSVAWSHKHDDEAFSLAGAQSKTALRYENGAWSIPYGFEPTTHILKPSISDLPVQHVVEHLSQRSASLLGINSAHTQCVEIEGEGAVLVRRYDREPEGDSYVRVHQEDMCQALGLPPSAKYQEDGGPGVSQIADLLRSRSVQPSTDLRLFRDALIYNWLIVGTDAHAKNYSMLLQGDDVRMAPLYDLCSVLPYPAEMAQRRDNPGAVRHVSKNKLAMKIGRDYYVLKSDYRAAWERTSRSLGLPENETLSRATELASVLPEVLDQAINELPHKLSSSPYVEKLREEVSARSRHCRHLKDMHRPSRQGDFKPPLSTETQSGFSVAGMPIQPEKLRFVEVPRCGHVGVRSGMRCFLRVNHKGHHRY